MVKQSRIPAIPGPKVTMNVKVVDRTSLLSSDRGARDRGDLCKGNLDSGGLLLVWARRDGDRLLFPFQVK